jgi:hypothetical protein
MRKPAKFLVIVLFCALALMIYLWFQFGVVRPYNLFRVAEVEAIPEFDKLNESVSNSLPMLPEGVSLIRESSGGIDAPVGLHGRYLYLSFKSSTPAQSNAIRTDYRTYLLNHGWSEVKLNVSSDSYLDRYFHETSCIELDTYSIDLTGEFKITIWHDFKSQSFSPAIPNELFMGFFEVGKTSFAECPWRSP